MNAGERVIRKNPVTVALRLTIAAIFLLALNPAAGAVEFAFQGPRGENASAFPAPDRPVADVISPIWHSEQERDAAGEPVQIIQHLGIKPGMRIADIGAGSGYYTVRLSPVVGPAGLIVAQDIIPSYLQDLSKRVRELKLDNVTVSLGEPHDPRLAPGTIDVALLVHMYHEIASPYALLYNLAPALKADGRVGIVDSSGDTAAHGTPPKLLTCELAAVGYRQIGFHKLDGSDAYLAIFAAPRPQARPRPEAIKACRGTD